MTYYIKQVYMGHQEPIEISESEAIKLKTASNSLSAAFALEETFDLLISNYTDMEREVIDSAIHELTKKQFDYKYHYEVRSSLNRRIVNLLTSTKLYLDQAPQHLGLCTELSEGAKDEFKARTNQHYDRSFSYRFMEALRNHVQHNGSAAHSVCLSKERLHIRISKYGRFLEEREIIENTVLAFAQKKYIKDNPKFKKSVCIEMPEKVNLTEAAREYVGCLGDLHELVRAKYKTSIEYSRSQIENARNLFLSANKIPKDIGLAVVMRTENESSEISEEILTPLTLEWDDVRISLQTRNYAPKNIGEQWTTNHKLLKGKC
jgi:hypothetical protein